jgi:hypothetical protein
MWGLNMNKGTIVAAVLLSTVASASASSTGDWPGVVKVQASYNDPTYTPARLGIELMIDVVYDKPGRAGKAWGTLSIMTVKDTAHSIAPATRYYHAICVGKFSGDKWSVAAEEVKSVGTAFPHYVTFEFNTNGSGWRSWGTTSTLAAAKATCDKQSGVYPAVFDHGYFNAY